MADITLADVRQKYPQYEDMSDDQLGQALHSKFYADMPYNQFATKIGLTQPAAPAPTAAPPLTVGRTLGGAAEIAGAGVANIPGMVLNAAHDLYNRVTTGNETSQPLVPTIHPGVAGQQVESAVANSPVGQAVGSGASALADRFNQNAGDSFRGDLVRNGLHVMQDFASIVAPAKGLEAGATAAATPAADTAATPAYRLGFRNGEGQPIAKLVAGTSGQPALKVANQAAGNNVFLSEAGVTPGVKPDADAFAAARAPANSVYNRAAAAVPTTTLSPAAQEGISNAGQTGLRMTTGSPDAAAQVQALQQQLLAPGKTWTGDQVVNEVRGLRQEGYARLGSDDPDSAALGRAQLDMSHALEQHITDNLPTNAPVSADQLAQARVALAKNHTVESAMSGDDVDLAKLGRVANKDRDLMTGPMADAADFVNNNQSVIGLPGKMYEQPGVMSDISKLGDKSLLNVGTIPAALANVFGLRTAARAALTGGAREATPVTGLGGEFGDLPMNHLTPPAGNVGVPHQPALGPMDQGLGSRGSLDLQPPPGDLSMQQRDLGALPQGAPPNPGLGLELSPGRAYSPNQPALGPMDQGLGSRGNISLTPPPGVLEPYQRPLDLGDELLPKKKPKGS